MGWAHQDIAAAWGLSRRFELSSGESVLAHWWQIRATAVRHLSSHANTLTQRGMRVDGLADIYRVCTHFNGERDLANHVACMRADHAATHNFAVTVRPRGCHQTAAWLRLHHDDWQWRGLMQSMGTDLFFTLMPWALAVFCQAYPCDSGSAWATRRITLAMKETDAIPTAAPVN